MKAPKKPSRRLDVIRLLGDFARANGISLNDPALRDLLVRHIDDVIATEGKSPIVVHGLRTQVMFAFVAEALGGCASVTEEDAGDFVAPDASEKQRPDYRVVTSKGEKFWLS